jgi:hypothetical protein
MKVKLNLELRSKAGMWEMPEPKNNILDTHRVLSFRTGRKSINPPQGSSAMFGQAIPDFQGLLPQDILHHHHSSAVPVSRSHGLQVNGGYSQYLNLSKLMLRYQNTMQTQLNKARKGGKSRIFFNPHAATCIIVMNLQVSYFASHMHYLHFSEIGPNLQ